MTMNLTRRNAALCLLGLLASFVSIVSDLLLLYVPGEPWGVMGEGPLFLIPDERAFTGLLIGIISIPLMVIGLPALLQVIPTVRRRMVMLLTGALLLSGLFCHFAFYHFISESKPYFLQEMNAATQAQYQQADDLLGISCLLFGGLFFIGFGVMGLWQLRREMAVPRWLIFFHPFVTMAVCVLAGIALPGIGDKLVPVMFNLSVGVFYAGLWAAGREEATPAINA